MTLRIKSLMPFVILIIAGASVYAQTNRKELRIIRKAARIHAAALTIDSHNDTPMWFTDTSYVFSDDHTGMRPRNRVDLPRMKAGGLDAAFFAVFVGQSDRTPAGNEKALKQALRTFEAIHRTAAMYPSEVSLALCAADAKRISKTGKRAIFIGMENGYPIGDNPDNVQLVYSAGARYISLCHTKNNDICDSSTDSTEHNGVSEFGEKVIAEMNRLGILVDVSHVSDKSFYDAVRLSKTPVIASHSCAKALCDNPRNMNDAMLKTLARNGGVIQMCILSSYVKTPPPFPERDSAEKALRDRYNGFKNLTDEQMASAHRDWNDLEENYPREPATVQDVVDHIDHIVKVAGIRHVGIGTDFDGGGGVKGCEDASEMGNITLELVRRGYSARKVKLIWGKNLLRVMSAAEKFADKNRETKPAEKRT